MTMRKIVLVLFFVIGAFAQDIFDDTGVRLALKIYDDCSKDDGLSPCLKKKAINFLDRLGRMDKLTLTDGVVVQKTSDAPQEGPAITEEQLEQTLPRSSDAKDAALSNMLLEKITNYIGSRSIKVDLPKISAEDLIEEGRQHGHHGGGGKKKGGKKHMKGMKDIKGAIMMGIAAKMAALIPLAIGGLFFLAKKALITAKIALIISVIIAVKKLLASKKGGGGGGGVSILGGDGGHGGYGGGGGWQAGGGGGWQSGGGGGSGGWQSSGGGWDKRSYNEAQNLAYNAHSPKQT